MSNILHRIPFIRRKRKDAPGAMNERFFEDMFGKLLRHTPVSIEIYDETGLLIGINSAYEKLWSVRGSSSVNKYNILADEKIRGTNLLEGLQMTYSKGFVVSLKHEYNLSSLSTITRPKWLKTKIIPILDSSGEVCRVLVINEPIEQEKRTLPLREVVEEKRIRI